PDLPDKGDVSDWLDADPRNSSRLVGICFDAPIWAPDAAPKPDTTPAPDERPDDAALQMVRADAVPQKPVDWLWQNRIARGKLTLIAGDPGLGNARRRAPVRWRLRSGTPVMVTLARVARLVTVRQKLASRRPNISAGIDAREDERSHWSCCASIAASTARH